MGKILLIDDDNLVRSSVARILIKDGHEVASAEGPEQGMKMVQGSEFDLVISDIRMRGKNGVDLVNEIQSYLRDERKKEIPIIFITGYPGDRLQLRADFLGEVLLKPFDLNQLIFAVREYL